MESQAETIGQLTTDDLEGKVVIVSHSFFSHSISCEFRSIPTTGGLLFGSKQVTYSGALKTAGVGFGIGYGHMPYISAFESAGIGTAYVSSFKVLA